MIVDKNNNKTKRPNNLFKAFLKSKAVKRIFDYLLSTLLLFITFPIFILISLLIKFYSKGDIFYLAERIGLNGKKFKMYKFRTFHENADEISKSFSVPDSDPRRTRLGKKLKKFRLNELPQLINVIKGEMSLVGPRPEVEYYIKKLKGREKEILTIKPGITDFASIKFINEGKILDRCNYKNKDLAYEKLIRPEKLRLQLKYLMERNIIIDVKLLLKTISLIFKEWTKK